MAKLVAIIGVLALVASGEYFYNCVFYKLIRDCVINVWYGIVSKLTNINHVVEISQHDLYTKQTPQRSSSDYNACKRRTFPFEYQF